MDGKNGAALTGFEEAGVQVHIPHAVEGVLFAGFSGKIGIRDEGEFEQAHHQVGAGAVDIAGGDGGHAGKLLERGDVFAEMLLVKFGGAGFFFAEELEGAIREGDHGQAFFGSELGEQFALGEIAQEGNDLLADMDALGAQVFAEEELAADDLGGGDGLVGLEAKGAGVDDAELDRGVAVRVDLGAVRGQNDDLLIELRSGDGGGEGLIKRAGAAQVGIVAFGAFDEGAELFQAVGVLVEQADGLLPAGLNELLLLDGLLPEAFDLGLDLLIVNRHGVPSWYRTFVLIIQGFGRGGKFFLQLLGH